MLSQCHLIWYVLALLRGGGIGGREQTADIQGTVGGRRSGRAERAGGVGGRAGGQKAGSSGGRGGMVAGLGNAGTVGASVPSVAIPASAPHTNHLQKNAGLKKHKRGAPGSAPIARRADIAVEIGAARAPYRRFGNSGGCQCRTSSRRNLGPVNGKMLFFPVFFFRLRNFLASSVFN